ncbi:O-antigen ligase family protein [Polynucleobacter sp. VK25]|uniref:O-antigen ligase family protein n=1 Tax=Polynucleobacter sp. VK25 TaxID=1758398 RepID=UPI001BFE8C25|nr:O-antigen ligase family protein [Polynucleobacter sp. VK25]QWD68638.1 O-antigen ligase family protein [Polynucleobacter sp. VK25]
MTSDTLDKNTVRIPPPLIWAQCIIFTALYSVWMIYELLYFRRILLISGALLSLYPIYQYRHYFLRKRAAPIWLMAGLFVWALFHLFFLAHDYPAQLMELKRIWKYAGLGAIFALGLGLSLASTQISRPNAVEPPHYWPLIYFGLCLPVLIYLLRYLLSTYGSLLGIAPPAFLRINSDPHSAYYIPKTDYIAFCLPVLALSLGQIYGLLISNFRLRTTQYLAMFCYLFVIATTLLLFYVQNTKNGIAYAAILITLFLGFILFRGSSVRLWQKVILMMTVVIAGYALLLPHLQKNDSWRTLIADIKIGFQLEQFPQWKFAGEKVYPNNEYGKMVSGTNYERAAWLKAGLQLALIDPLGYGLVEDSFKKMVKGHWPEASPNLSHSHSGWLDLILGLGFPGILCLLGALILNIRLSLAVQRPWISLIFWGLIANLVLWVTTEVAATVSFSALIFWICWASGLNFLDKNQRN